MLSVNHLQQVLEATRDVCARWYAFGLALGVPCNTLDTIEKTHKSVCDDCFRETLKEWLKGADRLPTWGALCNALKARTVGHRELAERLSKQHCK